MMPGGVTAPLTQDKLVECLAAIESYTRWYEEAILGCPSERWLDLRTVDDFYAWLEERESHEHSVVGVFTRFGRSIGLHKTGKGTPHLLSAGCYYDPEVAAPLSGTALSAAGGFL